MSYSLYVLAQLPSSNFHHVLCPMTLKSPRMLAQTLYVLREHRAKMTLEQFADKIGPSVSAIQRYESQNDQIGHRVLYRYQIGLGVPNGILLAISHIAAMTRDATTLPMEEERLREIQKLKLMGTYLRNLSDRILRAPPKGKPSLLAYEGIHAGDEETWVPLLMDLIMSTQKNCVSDGPTGFEDPEQLRILKQIDCQRSQRARDRSALEGEASQSEVSGSEDTAAKPRSTKRASRKTGKTVLR